MQNNKNLNKHTHTHKKQKNGRYLFVCSRKKQNETKNEYIGRYYFLVFVFSKCFFGLLCFLFVCVCSLPHCPITALLFASYFYMQLFFLFYKGLSNYQSSAFEP